MPVEDPAKDPERADRVHFEDVLVLHLRAAADVRKNVSDLGIPRHRDRNAGPPHCRSRLEGGHIRCVSHSITRPFSLSKP